MRTIDLTSRKQGFKNFERRENKNSNFPKIQMGGNPRIFLKIEMNMTAKIVKAVVIFWRRNGK